MRQAEAGHTGREVKARPCVQAAGRRTDRQTGRREGTWGRHVHCSLEARSLTPRRWPGHALSEDSGEACLPVPAPRASVVLGLWPRHPSLCLCCHLASPHHQ